MTFDAVLDCICFNAGQAEIDLNVFSAVSKHLIVISTDSVYHPSHKKVPQDENGTGYMEDGGYGALKREMELAEMTKVNVTKGGKVRHYR